MKRIWISLMAAVVLTVAAIAPAAGQVNQYSVPLDDVEDSGINGIAQINGVDEGLEVNVMINEGDTDGVHPVHIHEGTCDDLGDVVYPLENVEDGESVTVLEDLTFADVMTGEYAINAHLSEDEMGTFIMCGNIPEVEGLASDDDEDDDAAEDEDEDASEEEDEDATEDEDEDASEEDDEDATEEDDEEATEDEDEDASEEDDDDATEEDDEDATADEDDEDAEDLVPATGGDGMVAEGAVVLMTVLGGAALGTGLLVRRRFGQA